MSKKIRPRSRTALIILGLSLTAISQTGLGLGIAASAQQAQTATVNPKSAAVAAATVEVLQETSELRKLPILRQVKSGAQSRVEIERMIMNNLKEDSTPEEMRASELALKKLGLAPASFQLRPFIIALLTEQVAGYYDPKTQWFYLADWIEVDGQKPVMSHELVHALQDQHFNLRRFEKWPKGDSDAELAAHALVEGDATLTMMQYMLKNPLRAFAMMRAMNANGASTEQIERAPRAIRETLMFPYEQGRVWANNVFRRGGWEMVSKAFTDLPQSTEQILHADKYFAREAPVKVNTANVARLLGAGWRRVDYDVNGEWTFYLILDEFLKSDVESKKAAEGWGGDRYALYEQPRTGGLVLALASDWDTEQDAIEFFDAYVKRTTLRYKDAVPAVLGPRNDADATHRAWRSAEGAILMQRRGTRVLIIEGVPERANTRRLLKEIWP